MERISPPANLAAALEQSGLGDTEVLAFPGSTRTAQDAADSIGCSVAEIGKSLIFAGAKSGEPVLVIANGAASVNELALGEILGEAVRKPDGKEVKAWTGYAIGGVPPFGHKAPIRTLLDKSLLLYETIWVAAGTPRSVFPVSPAQLHRVTAAEVVNLQGS